MLKGVRRRIVEIPTPESSCFERAVFFLRPDKRSAHSSADLSAEQEARRYAEMLIASMEEGRSRPRFRNCIAAAVISILLLFIAAALLLLL